MDELFNKCPIFILIFARIIGFLFFNSIFGKKNLPALTKISLAAVFAFSITIGLNKQEIQINDSLLTFGILIFLEFVFGFVISFVIETIFSAIIFGGEIFDMQMGFSINKLYDASSGTEMSIIGLFIKILFILAFFITNSHYNLLRIMYKSFYTVPIGKISLNINAAFFMVNLLKETLEIGLKLAMPIIAAILIIDIGIGVLMRAIPQLNVFAINIYVKFIIGFLLLLKISPDLVEFSRKLTDRIFFNIEKLLNIAMNRTTA